MQDIVTSDLAEFGFRELEMVEELLKAYRIQGADFLGDKVKPFMNRHSGYVFLCDEDYNTAMMNGDKLEQWLNCGQCGNEGFPEDVKIDYDNDRCNNCE